MAAVGYGADRGPESEPEPSGEAAPRRWSSGARLLVAAAAVVLLLGAAAVGVIIADPDRLGMTYSGQPDGTRPDGARPGDGGRPGGVADPDAGGDRRGGAGAADEQLLTAPLAGRQNGTFVLADGLSSFELRVAELGDDLYRISTPAGSGVAGRPAVQGETVRLDLVESGTRGPRAVRVLLNERVAWRLHLVGGVSSQVLDLTRARLLGMELAGGSSRTEILLPPITAGGSGNPAGSHSDQPAGMLTVRLTGGTSQLDVRVPGETPVRVRAGAGAGSVVVREDRWDGVAAGSVLGTPGWDRLAARLYLDLVAGANSVIVSSSNR
ncbi:hypothetical protein DDE19_12815 [Micromonospora ureilytica]|uniref:Uncharacterized protein n=1 Tax=Micromonospora ureilytica TaxID=709868 RepID=A0A3N9XWK4_9ACTN|nr:hypothetical protein [Micromonospora ureilytica]RQX17032.1 hypothetical protein DDE19_12815 [Micromonospora ureilytica]